MRSVALSLPQHANPAHYRTLLIGLVFVLSILLALIMLPPVAHARSEILRQRLETDVRPFAATLTAVENDLQEMQAATRGYVTTGETSFLEQYRAAQDSLPANLQQLTELSPQIGATMASQVDELITVVERWQREGGDRQIELRQQGSAAAAFAEIASGESQAIFTAFRSRINDLQAQTRQAEAELTARISRFRALELALTSGLSVLGLVAAGVVLYSFRQILGLMRALDVERARAAALAQEARTDRQRLQTVFDHSPDGILLAEAPDGAVSLANPAALALLGPLPMQTPLRDQTWAQRLFRPGGERVPLDDIPLMRSMVYGETFRAVEVVLECSDGQRAPVLITSAPLRAENGTVLGAVAVLQDVRLLREVERMKSDFVALVSHELRTPLTAIHGCVQLLSSDAAPDSARGHELLQIIGEQSERLQELIDNLLNLSQIEAGALRLRRAATPPAQIVQNVIRQMRERSDGRRMQCDIAPDTALISADVRRIEQVLFNLLDNACKFSPATGQVLVTVQQQGDSVIFGVRDQGLGIPASERQRVFERFYQIAQPDVRDIGGSGLGLAICKALVEAHGGQIWVEDAPGGGAQFFFSLPAIHADAPPATNEVMLRAEAGKPSVLIVDDDLAIQRVLEASLPNVGYSVSAVMEGQAAIDIVAHQPPDVILLDIMLPGIDGFTLCRQLREWTNVPILMLTAKTSEKDVVRGLQLGADDYITKPFRLNELVARIEAVRRRAVTEPMGGSPALVQIGDLRIDLARREVMMQHTPVELTPTEYHILAYLARHAGQVLTHQQILEEVWGKAYSAEHHYLWVHIAHLRQKLEPNSRRPRFILTERGVGYRLANG